MIIKVTYFKYKNIEYDFFPKPREKDYEAITGMFDTEAECFGYLCQKAWEEKQTDEDIEKIEVICY